MSKIYLCKPGGVVLGTLTGIDENTANLKQSVSDTWELTFEIGRYTEKDGELVETTYYQSVSEMMELFVDDIDGENVYFQIDEEPAVNGDGTQEKKTVTAHSIETELSTKMLHNFKINCGVKDSQEYLVGYYNENGEFVNLNISPFDELPVDYIVVKNNYADYFQNLKDRLAVSNNWTVSPDDGFINQEGTFIDGTPIYPELRDMYYKYKRVYTDVKPDGRWEAYLNILDVPTGTVSTYNYNLYVYPGEVQADPDIINAFNQAIDDINSQTPKRTSYNSDAAYYEAVEAWEIMYNNKLNEYREYLDSIANASQQADFTRERLLAGLQSLIDYYTEYGNQLSLIDLALENASISGWTTGDIPSDIAEKKFTFNVDNQDILSFFKTNCTKAMKVLFDFDRFDKRVNIIDIQNEGDENDTGIFLTFRNLMNQVDVKSSSNEGVRTKFRPTGQNNLGITYVNFGEDNIIDLDWFVDSDDEYGEPQYVSPELREHYHAWKDYRDKPYEVGSDNTRRDDYIALTKRYNELLRNINDLKNKLPFDDCSIDFTKFTFEELNEAYTAYKNARQAIIDMYMADYHAVRFDIDTLEAFDSNDNLVTSIKETFYWEDFRCYHYTIIPNVKNALQIYVYTDNGAHNELREEDDRQYDINEKAWIAYPGGNPNYNGDAKIVTENESDSYVYDMDLYGPVELKAKINAWVDTAAVQYKKGFVLRKNNDTNPPQWDVFDPPPVDMYEPYDPERYEKYKFNTADEEGWINLTHGATGVQDEFSTKEAFFKLMNEYLDYVSPDVRYNSILARVDGIKDTIECDTSGDQFVKTATYAGFNPAIISRFILKLNHTNLHEGSLRLNINDTGAKPLYINGVPSSTTNHTLPSGAYEVRYHETSTTEYYDINTVDTLLVNSKGIIPLAQDALDAKEAEIAEWEEELAQVQTQRKALAESVSLDNFFKTNYPTTADEELKVLYIMLRESDYNNSNILTTSLDDIVTTIDKEKELFDDSVIALSEKAQPQLSFEITLDNLFALDDYKLMRDDVRLLKFIRVSIGLYHDAFKKLRIISITRNPLIPTEELTLEFSNMTYSLQGVNDFAHLFDDLSGGGSSSGSSSSSSSSGGTYGTNDSEITITNNILSALLRSKSYTNSIGSTFVSGLSTSSVLRNTMAQSGMFGKLEAGYVKINGDCLVDHIRSKNYIASTQETKGKGSDLNLSDGTFDYADGNLRYDGETLYVIGNIEVKDFDQKVKVVMSADLSSKYVEGKTLINGTHVITGTLSANTIKGGTLILGGSNNDNGTISMRNSSNTEYGHWNAASFKPNANAEFKADGTINLNVTSFQIGSKSLDTLYASSSYFIHDANGVHIATSSNYNSGKNILISSDGIYLRNNTSSYITLDTNGLSIEGANIKTTAKKGVWSVLEGNQLYFVDNTMDVPLELYAEGTQGYIHGKHVLNLESDIDVSICAYDSLSGEIEIYATNITMGELTRAGTINLNSTFVKSSGIYNNTSTSSANIRIGTGDENQMRLMRSTASSKRYKHDIQEISKNSINDIHKLYFLPVVQFVYNEGYLDNDDERYQKLIPGFIAEDVDKYYPIACDHNNKTTPEDWNFRYIIPPMLALIQEQHRDIEELKEQILGLKGEIL